MPKKKFTVQFDEQLDEVLEELSRSQGIPKTQVVRQSLALMKYLTDQRSEGNKIAIADKDSNVIREIVPT